MSNEHSHDGRGHESFARDEQDHTAQDGHDSPIAQESSLFGSTFHAPSHPVMHLPNLADVGMALVLLALGWVGAAGFTAGALSLHLFGVSTAKQAMADIRYTLGGQLAWYLIAFAGCRVIFPIAWRTDFFTGVEWRARAALRVRWKLLSAVVICLSLAVVDSVALPGPDNAPIDNVFRRPDAAWLMFAFGITLAPFFEELFFRGFLLPALCSATDWVLARTTKRAAPQPDAEGRIVWSAQAMAIGAVLTSIPFALMHGAQTGYSFGPFLLLICVSLALCWIRLVTRSLAASTIVHASYNLLLFSIMLVQTGGFQHLDRL
jgi:uncharacterized protein